MNSRQSTARMDPRPIRCARPRVCPQTYPARCAALATGAHVRSAPRVDVLCVLAKPTPQNATHRVARFVFPHSCRAQGGAPARRRYTGKKRKIARAAFTVISLFISESGHAWHALRGRVFWKRSTPRPRPLAPESRRKRPGPGCAGLCGFAQAWPPARPAWPLWAVWGTAWAKTPAHRWRGPAWGILRALAGAGCQCL
jgi:hypothetical protein